MDKTLIGKIASFWILHRSGYTEKFHDVIGKLEGYNVVDFDRLANTIALPVYMPMILRSNGDTMFSEKKSEIIILNSEQLKEFDFSTKEGRSYQFKGFANIHYLNGYVYEFVSKDEEQHIVHLRPETVSNPESYDVYKTIEQFFGDLKGTYTININPKKRG